MPQDLDREPTSDERMAEAEYQAAFTAWVLAQKRLTEAKAARPILMAARARKARQLAAKQRREARAERDATIWGHYQRADCRPFAEMFGHRSEVRVSATITRAIAIEMGLKHELVAKVVGDQLRAIAHEVWQEHLRREREAERAERERIGIEREKERLVRWMAQQTASPSGQKP